MSVRAAGLVIFRRFSKDVEYLMMQTSYGEHHWTPPKGHVDPGESDLQTALRETKEEAGLHQSDFEVLDFKKELHYPVKGKPKVVVYWLSELKNEHAQVKLSEEHQAFEWASIDRATELAKYQDLQNLLKDCDAYVRSH